MADVSDEMLMAFADGLLNETDREAVEAAIRENPELRKKVEKFRATSAPIGAAFRGHQVGYRTQVLADALRRGKGLSAIADADASGHRLVQHLSDGPDPVARSRQRWLIAKAASIALLIGGALGWLLHPDGAHAPHASGHIVSFANGRLLAQGRLRELLETKSSGIVVLATATGGKPWQLKASFTFRTMDHAFCRRYEMNTDGAGVFGGYACRSSDGQWVLRAHTALPARSASGKGFVPAGGEGSSALDAAIRSVMEGDVLESREEAALLAGNWANLRK